jgi:pilus assembly protein FimV
MPSAEALTDAPPAEGGDPLETKLALAEEFVSIGDEDGARALIEEVVAEATGDMRAKAQRALANLS